MSSAQKRQIESPLLPLRDTDLPMRRGRRFPALSYLPERSREVIGAPGDPSPGRGAQPVQQGADTPTIHLGHPETRNAGPARPGSPARAGLHLDIYRTARADTPARAGRPEDRITDGPAPLETPVHPSPDTAPGDPGTDQPVQEDGPVQPGPVETGTGITTGITARQNPPGRGLERNTTRIGQQIGTTGSRPIPPGMTDTQI